MKNKLAIGLPVHNGADHIIETISSIRKADKKIKIYISNNYSTDDLLEKIEAYIKKNNEKNILIKNTPKFLHWVDSLKTAMKVTNAEYILLISSNDIMDKNYINYIKKIISKNKPDLIVRNYHWFKNKKEFIIRQKKKENYEGFLDFNNMKHLKIFIDKTDQQSGLVIKKVNSEKYMKFMTYEYFTEILSMLVHFVKNKKKIFFVDKYFLNIRTDHGLSLDGIAYTVSPVMSWRKILFKYFKKDNEKKAIDQYLSTTFISLVQVRLFGDYKLFTNEVKNYLKLNSNHIINLRFIILVIFLALTPKFLVNITKYAIKNIQLFLTKLNLLNIKN